VLCAAGALLLLAATPARADVTYFVTVNTSSVSGTSGNLDFQFNPGNNTTQMATATISAFTTDGTFTGVPPQTSGNVTGTLPAGPVTFCSSGGAGCASMSAINEYFTSNVVGPGFTYGTSFSFLVTLGGPAINAPNGTATAGSTFGVGLYDIAGNPILTNQGGTTGFAGQIDINLNGSTTPTAWPSNGVGGASVVTFQTINRPTITKTFGSATVMRTAVTSLTFTLSNLPAGANVATLHNVSFTDTLPAGLAVATPNGLTGACGGGTITATAGSGAISLTGATLPNGATCTFSVNVTGVTVGPQVNTTSTVTTTEGVTGDPATASTMVVFISATPTLSLPALAGFALLLAGLGSFLARRAQTIG